MLTCPNVAGAKYDEIGTTYAVTRKTDPRIARAIWRALGEARTVLNVGAGTGSYEPPDRSVVALEPSPVMIGQRGPGAAPVVQGCAEQLPFRARSFDAAMAILSDHHWSDRAAGLAEMRRVSRGPVVVLTWDERVSAQFWLVRDYFPCLVELERGIADPAAVAGHLAPARIETVHVPNDCVDGLLGCYWARPRAYLDPVVRAGSSAFSRIPAAELAAGLEKLEADIESGRWHSRNGALLGQGSVDLGYRLVVSEGS